MNNTLRLIGRKTQLFNEDIKNIEERLKKEVSSSTFLVIDGGWTAW